MQTLESAADKHLESLQMYVTTYLSNEIIISNEISGSVEKLHVFILAEKLW